MTVTKTTARAATVRRRATAVAFAILFAVALAACAAGPDYEQPTPSSSMTISGDRTTTTTGTADGTAGNGQSARIDIRVGARTVIGTLNDSPASRDLLDQLPLTLDMSDHGSVEKTGPLPAELSTANFPSRADPNPGDIGYYAPGNDFVLYYGDQDEFPGIVILGSMDSSGSEAVGSIDGDVTVTITHAQ
ncbi:cyclophilin-like fold protein [Williamsia muralis]|uniref:Cyclophilin-like fold protein n=1 Tax=Williamsia marianensis TaxID=85044 RepID=A0ABU4EPA2_WILMA|nr:cyclophilin-like fold protein [Williamsia muralis]MDV7133072.1 cyclophilin-like fold protein [Williamsia muralis]